MEAPLFNYVFEPKNSITRPRNTTMKGYHKMLSVDNSRLLTQSLLRRLHNK